MGRPNIIVDIIQGVPGAWLELLLSCVAFGLCYWVYRWWVDQA